MGKKKNKGKKFRDVQISHSGDVGEIVIPDGMSLENAAHWLNTKYQEQEKDVVLRTEIHGFPMDVANSFMKAVHKQFGFSRSRKIVQSFFGAFEVPPQHKVLVDADGNKINIPVGECTLPTISGTINLDPIRHHNVPALQLTGRVKQKDANKFHDLADETRRFLSKESIYKGRALVVDFDKLDGEVDWDTAPKYMPISDKTLDDVILNKPVQDMIHNVVITPITHYEECAKDGDIPHGFLFSGTNGTGKTLMGQALANAAVKNKVTFLHITETNQLKRAVEAAREYEPAVVFVEDIDKIMQGTKEEVQQREFELRNTLDGVYGGQKHVTVIMTTNHRDMIPVGLIRAGRIDQVIEFSLPEAKTLEKLLRYYGKNRISEDTDLTSIVESLEGQSPAEVATVVQMAKISAIQNNHPTTITEEDLQVIIRGRSLHHRLSSQVQPDQRTGIEKLGDAIVVSTRQLADALNGSNGHTEEIVDLSVTQMTPLTPPPPPTERLPPPSRR